jgi:hypothetical protein
MLEREDSQYAPLLRSVGPSCIHRNHLHPTARAALKVVTKAKREAVEDRRGTTEATDVIVTGSTVPL